MHIAFCEAHYDSYSGAQQSMEPLISQSNFEKTTVVTPSRGKFLNSLNRGNSDLVILNLGSDVHKLQSNIRSAGVPTRSKLGLKLINYYKDAFLYFRSVDIDVVYCNNLTSLWLYGPPAKLAGKPVIWFVRSDSDAYSKLNQLGTHIADYIILISKGVSNRFGADSIDELDDKFYVINTGINVEKFAITESTNISDDKVDILHVGTIQPRKGQQDLVKAVDAVSNDLPEFRLRFAGSVSAGQDEYYEGLKQLIEQSSIEDCVELLGYREDIPTLLNGSDFVVLPSTSEGLPRAVLEASATGTPCIATRVGGAEEIITDGEDGYLVTVGDQESLSQRILDLASDPKLREEMGARAQTNVTERFTVERYVENFEKFVIRRFS